MRKYEYKRKYIDGAKFGYYISGRIKWIVIATLIITILVTGTQYVSAIRDKKNHDKKYPNNKIEKSISLSAEETVKAQQYYQTQKKLDDCREYMDNAPYMKLDYNNVTLRTIHYAVWKDNGQPVYTSLQKMVARISEDSVIEEISKKLYKQNMNISYIRDMIKVEIYQGNSIKVYISASNSEYTSVMGDVIKNAFTSYKEEGTKYSELVDSTTTTRDVTIRDAQQAYVNQMGGLVTTIEKLEKELSDKQKNYVRKYSKEIEKGSTISFGKKIKYYQESKVIVRKIDFVKKGIKLAIGAFLAMIVLFFLIYILSPYIWSGKSIKDSMGLEYLGRVKDNGKKDDRDKIAFILNDAENEYTIISHYSKAAEQLEFIKADNYINMDQLVSGEKKLAKDAKIILAEKAGKVTYASLDRELQLLEKYEDNIQGYISFE